MFNSCAYYTQRQSFIFKLIYKKQHKECVKYNGDPKFVFNYNLILSIFLKLEINLIYTIMDNVDQ